MLWTMQLDPWSSCDGNCGILGSPGVSTGFWLISLMGQNASEPNKKPMEKPSKKPIKKPSREPTEKSPVKSRSGKSAQSRSGEVNEKSRPRKLAAQLGFRIPIRICILSLLLFES